MERRRGAGRARVARWLAGVVVALAAVVVSASAGARLRPLDYHAVLVNGTTIGSAFLLADGVAVTNRHVLRGRLPGEPVLLVAPDLRSVEARVVAFSPWMDLAVLRVPAGFLPVVGAVDAPERVGLAVTAAGIDGADDATAGQRMEAPGEVVAARAEIPAYGPGLIARMPGARPGFSGGPLFDGEARLVGMLTAIRVGPEDATLGAGARPEVEAFALRAGALRAEVRRLIGPGMR